ncbi:dTDP-4-dehydrorhamnose 3,5-epimerase [Sphingomonas sp. GlSt437]|uniref:dTDP-4-dehydrorhamnose 3,5-epimerase n=1 Tax=Sphingomonas sp. GlSt437 TaxID=3389970 RepID=UPI003A8C2777
MEIQSYDIRGILLVTPQRIGDQRGYFAETFRLDLFQDKVGNYRFVQDNESLNAKAGTIRGLHFQCRPEAQGKLVRCTSGALFDVAVDIRVGSPTFGQWIGETLTPGNGKQLWVPPGFAHGFCSLLPDTVIYYKVTDSFYSVECDKGVAWNDPAIGIVWPDIADADTLSAKDRSLPLLSELPPYFSWSD